MAKFDVLDNTGKVVSSLNLKDEVFSIEPHKQAIFDVVYAIQSAKHQGTHDVKDRSEVRGGGRKPWRQKGTGRARQGSTRSPQWRTGGIVFGPTPRSYNVKVNKKVAKLAMRSALSYHVEGKTIIFVDKIAVEALKTKQALNFLNNIKVNGSTLLVDVKLDQIFEKAVSNIQTAEYNGASHVNVYDILRAKTLVLSVDAAKYFEGVLSND